MVIIGRTAMPSPCGTTRGRDLADRENRALRRIDDGDKTIDAEHTEIRDRESTAFVVQRKKFFLLRLVRQLAALFGQLLER